MLQDKSVQLPSCGCSRRAFCRRRLCSHWPCHQRRRRRRRRWWWWCFGGRLRSAAIFRLFRSCLLRTRPSTLRFRRCAPHPPSPLCRSFSFAFTRYLSPPPCCTDARLSRIPVSSVGPSRLLLSVVARRKRVENVPWPAVWPASRVGVDMQSCLRWRVFFGVMRGLG